MGNRVSACEPSERVANIQICTLFWLYRLILVTLFGYELSIEISLPVSQQSDQLPNALRNRIPY